VTAKKREASSAHPDRQQQFEFLASQRQAFHAAGWPSISVDSKKKELIGHFKNPGRAWGQEAEAVHVHDFPHGALLPAVPYGIYDVPHNRGSVYVGASADTPEFAVTALARWCCSWPMPEAGMVLALAALSCTRKSSSVIAMDSA
jgi:Rhodopirellula transposase DDE domain